LESASGLSKQISLRVDQNTDILNMLSRMPDIISMDSNRQFPLLKQIQHTYPWMYLIFVIGPDGLCTTWVDRDSDSLFLDYKDKIAFNENRLTRQIFSPQMNLEPAMVFSKPIRSNDRTVGFLVTCTFFYKISSLISTWQLGQSGYAFLVDENYKVIVHKVDEFIDEERIFTDHPLIREYHSGKRKLIYFEDDNDVEYVGLVTQLDLGWFLAIQQKESETFAILTKERNTAYFALTITIISVVLITWCLGRAITIPIQKIILAADRISVGDFNVDLGKPKNDEMGDLITAIITMKNCIRESLNRLQNRRTLPRKSSPTMTAPKHKKFAEHFED
ncbi:MAG: methyl-accepting chemotaxis protein, partial [Desulfobacteraceae bacterium]|jgi:methyl-accepting chemotaxis protein